MGLKEDIVVKVKQIKQKQVLPEDMVDLIEQVCNLHLPYWEQTAQVGLSEKEVKDAYAQGKPVLARSDFPVKEEEVIQLLAELIELTKKVAHLKGPVKDLEVELKDKSFVQKGIKAVLNNDHVFFRTYGEKFSEQPGIVSFLFYNSITPLAVKIARAILPLLPEEDYDHGTCPVCGSLPLLSSLEGKEGRRYNYCSFCLSKYKSARLNCVFCNYEYQKDHFYFQSKELPGFRVDVCDQCKQYIKTVDFRKLDQNVIAVLDDLAALPLDFKAREAGYLRPTLSFWGF